VGKGLKCAGGGTASYCRGPCQLLDIHRGCRQPD
jgi:hypothetical protein